MERDTLFGDIVRQHRQALDLTQAELARRVACATITIRKIEYNSLRPSIQIAERLAASLKIPLKDRTAFVRLARAAAIKTPTPSPIPTPPPTPEEIGLEDLSGRAIRGYELGDRIGEGGFGVVYRAVQPLVEREVAVKIILPRFADHPEFIRRFEAEAQLVARLEHPYIVPFYDYWREPGAAYLVMRLMRGGSLHSLLKDGPLALDFILRMLVQVGGALYSAHRMGVIHRDLKPANILLDEDRNTYLADFGVAKNLGNPEQTSDTLLAGIIGSPAYVSPEQIRSEPIRPQADIYALGVLLFELLTGRQPFQGPTPIDYAQQHLNQPTPPLLDFNPALPASLEPVLFRATAKHPENRYPDISALVKDFQVAVTAAGIEIPASISHDWLPAEKIDLDAIENPYKGLRPFQESDAEQFYGRETLVQDLLGRLAEENDISRFLAVVGPSGSGKSSAVKAGLIPSLRRGGLPGSEHWFFTECTPGSHPFEELETALLRVAVNPPEHLLHQLREDERGLLRAVKRILPADNQIDLVLLIDQFEELFTLVEDEEVRAAFLESLLAAMLDPHSRLRVVITLRADFTDRPLEYVDFGDLLRQRSEFVLPLTTDELELAIIQPAREAGLVLEAGLCQRIIRDLGDQPGTLPLLQYTLTELFERRTGRRLTLQAYQDSGGVLGSLGKRAEEIYRGFDLADQLTTRQVFLRLVTLGEGVEDTRRRVLLTELEALSPTTSSNKLPEHRRRSELGGQQHPELVDGSLGVREVLDAFGRARLLSFDRDPITRGPTVEVAHEALLREWSQLHEWLDQSRVDIRSQRILGSAAAEWSTAKRDPGFLLRGSRLDQFAAWVETTDLALTRLEADYIAACLAERRAREAAEAKRLAHEAALERRSRNILRILVGVMAVAAVVAIGLSIYAFRQRQDALVQAAIGLASQAELQAEGRSPETAVLLALEALENYPYTWQAEKALGNAILKSRLRVVIPYNDNFQSMQWSSDGSKILISGMELISQSQWKNANTRILDTSTGEELLKITDGEPNMASWSPDESSMLTLNEQDMIATVWDVKSGNVRFILDRQDIGGDLNTRITDWEPWSPSGDRFLIYTANGLVKILDGSTGEVLQTLTGHDGYSISQAAWSPGGNLVAVTSGTTIVYQADDGQALYSIQGSIQGGFGSWSPNGAKFVTRGLDGAKVYEAATGRKLFDLEVPLLNCWRALWSPDGSSILTVHGHEFVIIWDAVNGQEIHRIEDLNWLTAAEWSPSGDLFLVSAGGGSVYLFDPLTGLLVDELSGTFAWSFTMVFSQDGEQVAVVGEDNTINIFDLSEASFRILVPTCHSLTNPAWSPDGQQVAFGSNCPPNNSIKIWDSQSGEHLIDLEKKYIETYSWIQWSPSGDRILTTTYPGSPWIWDALSFELLFSLPNLGALRIMGNSAWSPDGSRITLAYENGKVVIYDSFDGKAILSFFGHKEGEITSALWSPDGTRILSSSSAGEALIWDAATGEVLLDLLPEDFELEVPATAWTKDGEQVILLSEDGFIHIFDAHTGEKISQFFTRAASTNATFSLSPAGDRIIIGGYDNVATVWDIANGAEMITYDVRGVVIPAYSPDGTQVMIGNSMGKLGTLQIFPVWDSLEALVAYSKECCVTRELTADERKVFGLPPLQD